MPRADWPYFIPLLFWESNIPTDNVFSIASTRNENFTVAFSDDDDVEWLNALDKVHGLKFRQSHNGGAGISTKVSRKLTF